MKYTLYHSEHTGSQIILNVLELCGANYGVVELDYGKTSAGKDKRLKKVNPPSSTKKIFGFISKN